MPLPKPRIQIDVEPALLGRNYDVDVAIAGDARLTLEALLQSSVGPPDPAWLARVSDVRGVVRERVRSNLGPYERLVNDLRQTLPRDTIVVRDVTVPASTWGGRLLETYAPRSTLYSATYAIGMGLGLAIGAAIGNPEREVLLLAGDGGFVTAVGELATVAQERAHVRVVLFNDGGYGVLRSVQDRTFDGRHFAVDLDTPDFQRMAETFGVWSGQVRSPVEFGPQLREALAHDGPSLIEVDVRALAMAGAT